MSLNGFKEFTDYRVLSFFTLKDIRVLVGVVSLFNFAKI